LACSSATACGLWRHFRSGLRRRVPRPEQGASTSTRSILPARRLMRSSRSWAICAGCTLDRPLRASRGLSAPAGGPTRRRRTAARCCASPRPAPASCRRRRRRSRPPSRRAWRPPAGPAAGCLRPAPRPPGEQRQLVQRRLALDAQAPGRVRRGLGRRCRLRPGCACTSSRLAFSVLTRRSSGAGSAPAPAPAARTPRPAVRAAALASQSGRLWRSFSGSPRGRWRHLGQPAALAAPAHRAGRPRCPARPGWPAGAPARPACRCARCCTAAGAGAARCRWSRPACGARAGPGAVLAEEGRHHAIGRASSFSTAQQFGGQVQQGVGVHRPIIGQAAAPAAAAGAVELPHHPAVRAQPAFDEPAHRLRVDHVLGGQHARGQRARRRRQHRHGRLHHDGPVVQLGRHEVHRGAGQLAARLQCPAVRVQAREGRQQRGVDVEQPPFVARTKAAPRMRMKPASTTRSGAWRRSPRQRGVEGLARGRVPCGRPPPWRCRAHARRPGRRRRAGWRSPPPRAPASAVRRSAARWPPCWSRGRRSG
jgi:hypothetical protein